MRHWCKTESPKYMDKLAARMDQKTDKSGNCHVWNGSKVGFYGQIKVANKNTLAHRVAYLLANGNVPDECDVLHQCDNPLCVNPAHLFLGSHKDNMQDKAKKGRAPSKLADVDIPVIRQMLIDGCSLCSIARKFRVGHHAIGDIRDGITWAHV
jgi:hypothetical protein